VAEDPHDEAAVRGTLAVNLAGVWHTGQNNRVIDD
jgi:hypothetical protein